MLEGLEITEINLSNLRIDNWTFRIDSEFLKKGFLQNIQTIKSFSKGFIKLKESIGFMSGGATPLGAEYSENGIPFLRVQNIMQNYFNLNDVVYLNKKQDEEIKRSRLKENDVLLTITGVSYGKSAVVPKQLENSNINQHSVKITLNKDLNPYFFSTFLNCKFGKLQSDKNIVGVTRPALDYEVIRNFNVPKLDLEFQKSIEIFIKKAYSVELQSKQTYTQAENLLLKEIGLQNFTPNAEAVNIKSFKESFGTSGRLDAEYYQPKYEALISKIKNYKNGFYEFDYFIDNFSTGFAYKSETYLDKDGVPLIRINNIGKGILDLSNSVHIPLNDLYLSPKDIANENDVLISMSGTIGNSCKVPKNVKAVVNQRIMRVTPKNINTDVLPILINSIIGQYQLERIGTGGVQTNISGNDIKSILIPNIEKEKQEQIAQLVSESFRLKHKSENLLEVAKQAVEIAIEQSEETAMKFIEQNS